MKKFFLSAIVLIGTTMASNAKDPTPGVKVKVNLNLNTFQSIEIGSGAVNGASGYGDVVTLNYANADDYRNGVSTLVNNQLKVTSVGSGFKVKATLSDADFTRDGSGGAEKISAKEILRIEVGKNLSGVKTGKMVEAGSLQEWNISGTLGSNGQASVLDQELDVKYFGLPISDSKLKQYFHNVTKEQQAIAYTVDVTYTIAPN